MKFFDMLKEKECTAEITPEPIENGSTGKTEDVIETGTGKTEDVIVTGIGKTENVIETEE